jgi:glycosyltransferase involved in cell wall biosynthesis
MKIGAIQLMTDEAANPKITIITVCFNASRTVEQTLRSVLDQGFPGLEYIIIDGGSTDGTLDIVERYRDSLSVVVSEPDNGIYDAFNKGIRLATGELIGILNADDFYSPWALEKVAKAYAAHRECDVFFGKIAAIDEENQRWIVYSLASERWLSDRMCLSHPAVFVPKSAYGKYGLFDESYKIAGDWDFLLRLYKAGARFCPVDEVLTAFRMSGVSSDLSPRQIREKRKVFKNNLDKSEAFRKILKMQLKYYGRWFMKATGTYRLYAAYRDSVILNVEYSGEYGDNADSIWDVITEKIE